MAERYQIISHNDNRMYQNDCPVICCAYNILLDTATDDLLLQIKFDNLNKIPVRELTLSVECFDVSGSLLSSDIELSYIVTDGSYRKTFGSDNAKNLPNNKTRKISFKVKSIVFGNGDVWNNTNNSNMVSVPQQRSISDYLKSAELVSEFEKQTPNIHKMRLEPVYKNKYWLCSCGEINLNDTNKCHACSTEKHHLMHIADKTVIVNIINNQKEKDYSKALEYFNKKDYKNAKRYFEECLSWKNSKEYIEKIENFKKTKQKKITAVLFFTCFIIIASLIFKIKMMPSLNASLQEKKALSEFGTITSKTQVGDLVKFGSYEQDNFLESKETIDWIVLEKNNDKFLLISKNVLDINTFNNTGEFVSWETCDLRNWLNVDFINEAFSNEQINNVVETNIFTPCENPIYSSTTNDKVFILSNEELDLYFDNDVEKRAMASIYRIGKKITTTENACWYYSRDLKITWEAGKEFTKFNVIGPFNISMLDNKDTKNYGVRPAIWVDIS